MNKKSALVILDGWGIGSKDESDGIFLSKTPFFDSLIEKFPNALLKTFGKDVGLPLASLWAYPRDKWVIQRWDI